MCCGLPNLGKPDKKKTYKEGQCAVCVGMDNDKTFKQVYHCDLCNEWLCDKCESRLFGRGWLALKKMFTFN